jgi:aldose 1-epimerase
VRLRLERHDGEEGYPGAVRAQTTYRVSKDGRLIIDHRAETSASTIVSLTNHAFWNLAAADTVDDHLLRVNASHVLPVDDELIPAGPAVPVAGTRFDLPAATTDRGGHARPLLHSHGGLEPGR